MGLPCGARGTALLAVLLPWGPASGVEAPAPVPPGGTVAGGRGHLGITPFCVNGFTDDTGQVCCHRDCRGCGATPTCRVLSREGLRCCGGSPVAEAMFPAVTVIRNLCRTHQATGCLRPAGDRTPSGRRKSDAFEPGGQQQQPHNATTELRARKRGAPGQGGQPVAGGRRAQKKTVRKPNALRSIDGGGGAGANAITALRRGVVVSQGTTGTRTLFQVLCRLGIPTAHYHTDCATCASAEAGPPYRRCLNRLRLDVCRQSQNATQRKQYSCSTVPKDLRAFAEAAGERDNPSSPIGAHEALASLYDQASGCANGTLDDVSRCDARAWAARVRQMLDRLVAPNAETLGLTDVPAASFASYWANSTVATEAGVIISVRDPESWAASRLRNHGALNAICAVGGDGTQAKRVDLSDQSSAAPFDPFDLLACVERNRCTDLRACLLSQDRVEAKVLANAFRGAQQQLLRWFPKALVVDLFGGALQKCTHAASCKLQEAVQAAVSKHVQAWANQKAVSGRVAEYAKHVVCDTDAHARGFARRLPPAVVPMPAWAVARRPAQGHKVENPPPAFKFYVHFLGFNEWSEWVTDRVLLQEAVQPHDFVLPLAQSQHLTDVWLLNALRRHPQRTLRPEEASLHVLALPAFSSYALARARARCKGCKGSAKRRRDGPDSGSMGGLRQHYVHMQRVAAALETDPFFQAGAPFLVVMGHFYLHFTFGNVLLETLQKGNVILATSDSGYSTHSGLFERAVIIPYKATGVVEQGDPTRLNRTREYDFHFHGDLDRKDGGTRASLVELIAALQEGPSGATVSLSTSPLTKMSRADRNFPFERAGLLQPHPVTSLQDGLIASAMAMQRSKFCFVPSGDTLSSRRVFDALGAGCVPIILRNAADQYYSDLPFKTSIEWGEIAVIVTLPLPPSCRAAEAATLAALARTETTAVARMRARGREVFEARLAIVRNPTGVVDALMTELQLTGRVRSLAQHRALVRLWGHAPASLVAAVDAETSHDFVVLPKHRLLVCIPTGPGQQRGLSDKARSLLLGFTQGEQLALSISQARRLLSSPFWHAALLFEAVGWVGADGGNPLRQACGGLDSAALAYYDTVTALSLGGAALAMHQLLIAVGLSTAFARHLASGAFGWPRGAATLPDPRAGAARVAELCGFEAREEPRGGDGVCSGTTTQTAMLEATRNGGLGPAACRATAALSSAERAVARAQALAHGGAIFGVGTELGRRFVVATRIQTNDPRSGLDTDVSDTLFEQWRRSFKTEALNRAFLRGEAMRTACLEDLKGKPLEFWSHKSSEGCYTRST